MALSSKEWALISKSKYFNKRWYLKQYPDVAASKMNPARHYFLSGWREGRNPSPRFNTNEYLKNNPDVQRAKICPLLHWEKYGRKEGRHIGNVLAINYDTFAVRCAAKLKSMLSPSKRTILLVSHEFTYTGAPLSLLSAARVLKNNGYKIITLGLRDGDLRPEFEKLGQVIVTSDIKKYAYYAHRVDCAIVNTLVAYLVYHTIKNICPTIWWLREQASTVCRFGGAAEVLRAATNVYTMSEYSRDDFLAYNDEIQIIKHGMEDSYNNVAIDTNNISFAVVGTICERKGQDIFARAIKKIPAKIRNKATFYIVGKERNSDNMRAGIEALKIKNLIFVPEITDHAEMIKFYEKVSCVVIPSRDEPTSRIAIEAMMMGRPAIMSDTVGAKYLLNGKNGKLVRTESVVDLTRAMTDIIEHPNRLKSMSVNARNAYLKHNAMDVYERNLLKSVVDITRSKKILVHLHLFYHDQLDWFLKKLRNITCDFDLFVTVVEENDVSTQKLKAFKSDVNIIQVPNRGYDIYPFWLVLQKVDLNQYSTVLKIHTKNERKEAYVNNGNAFPGWTWRNSLVDALLCSKKRFKKNLAMFNDCNIGMLGNSDLIRDPADTPDKIFSTILKDMLENRLNQTIEGAPFICGTMFMVRPSILNSFKQIKFNVRDFKKGGTTGALSELAHGLERYFGILVKMHKKRLVGCTVPHKKKNIKLGFLRKLHKRILGRRSDMSLIKHSRFFDKKWYLQTYPDVAQDRMDPAWHYVKHGWRESRNPGPKFNTRAYLLANPDVARAGHNPLAHYERYGRFEGRKLVPTNRVQKTNASIMNYRTYNDLALDIKKNIEKLPTDIDLIVGIPRSGMIPAYIMGLALNKKVCSTTELVNGLMGNSGYTRKTGTTKIKNILVVDDTVNTGLSLGKVREMLAPLKRKYKIKYCAVYATNPEVAELVDVALNILPQPRMFQWNYLYHGFMARACFDMDGVLCWDPTDEQNDDGERYVEFVKTANPLFKPNGPIGYIVTSRLEKYRAETEQWLAEHGIEYKKLYMYKGTAEERRRLGLHAPFKASIYKQIKNSNMFIESNPTQAAKIAELSGKPCICCLNDKMYV